MLMFTINFLEEILCVLRISFCLYFSSAPSELHQKKTHIPRASFDLQQIIFSYFWGWGQSGQIWAKVCTQYQLLGAGNWIQPKRYRCSFQKLPNEISLWTYSTRPVKQHKVTWPSIPLCFYSFLLCLSPFHLTASALSYTHTHTHTSHIHTHTPYTCLQTYTG